MDPRNIPESPDDDLEVDDDYEDYDPDREPEEDDVDFILRRWEGDDS